MMRTAISVQKIFRNGVPSYLYPDGTVLPIMAGAQDGSSDPWGVVLGGGGGTKPLPKVPIGTVLVDGSGKHVTVAFADSDGTLHVSDGAGGNFMSDTKATTHVLNPGPYQLPGTTQILNITQDGSIVSQDTATKPTPPDVRPATGPDGKPIPGLWMVDGKITTSDQLGNLLGGGTGGGSTHVAQPYGVNAPDPLGAAKVIADQYDQAIAAGKLTFDQAQQAWDNQWKEIAANANIDTTNVSNKLSADTTNVDTGTKYMQAGQTRAANIATAQGNLTNEATQRAKIMQAILSSSLPAGQTLNVVGGAPGTPNAYLPQQVNVDQMLNQGLPSLQSQYTGLQTLFPQIGAPPTITAGTVAPVVAPPSPVPTQLPPPPDQTDLINRILQGSVMGWA